ncbi:MAG: hypothetical protein EBS53_16970, partial [Bacteroidetes bacterium]|nr:hypothetical protein [Bacteroidota bacterium]
HQDTVGIKFHLVRNFRVWLDHFLASSVRLAQTEHKGNYLSHSVVERLWNGGWMVAKKYFQLLQF